MKKCGHNSVFVIAHIYLTIYITWLDNNLFKHNHTHTYAHTHSIVQTAITYLVRGDI